jgi:hypothetical protein
MQNWNFALHCSVGKSNLLNYLNLCKMMPPKWICNIPNFVISMWLEFGVSCPTFINFRLQLKEKGVPILVQLFLGQFQHILLYLCKSYWLILSFPMYRPHLAVRLFDCIKCCGDFPCLLGSPAKGIFSSHTMMTGNMETLTIRSSDL